MNKQKLTKREFKALSKLASYYSSLDLDVCGEGTDEADILSGLNKLLKGALE